MSNTWGLNASMKSSLSVVYDIALEFSLILYPILQALSVPKTCVLELS